MSNPMDELNPTARALVEDIVGILLADALAAPIASDPDRDKRPADGCMGCQPGDEQARGEAMNGGDAPRGGRR